MAATNKSPAVAVELELHLTRVFEAPPAMVFQAWTQREHIIQWLAPRGFVITHCQGDFRPGGAWRSCMRSPQGVDHWVGGVYREIIPDQRLVFTHVWDTEDGTPGHETLVTVTFADQNGKTLMNFHQATFKSAASRDGHEGGWTESFDRLDEQLRALHQPTDGRARRELVITRVFDAPLAVVFKAWIDPKQMATWWGPKGFTNPVCEMDVRPGGKLRIHMRAPNGAEHPMTGVFREVVEPRRLVFLAVAVDAQDKPLLENLVTVTFEEHRGKTKLTMHSSAVGIAPIAAQMLAGMEAGWSQSLDRLGELVGGIAR